MNHPLTDYGLVYLASPYTLFPAGQDAAFQEAATLTARLATVGVKAFSPICHSHPVAQYGCIDPLDHDFWLDYDEAFMEVSDACAVAMFESWQASDGIDREIKFFRSAKRPVWKLDPVTLKVEPYAGW